MAASRFERAPFPFYLRRSQNDANSGTATPNGSGQGMQLVERSTPKIDGRRFESWEIDRVGQQSK